MVRINGGRGLEVTHKARAGTEKTHKEQVQRSGWRGMWAGGGGG